LLILVCVVGLLLTVLYSDGLIVHFLEEQYVGPIFFTGSVVPGDDDQTKSQNKTVLLEILVVSRGLLVALKASTLQRGAVPEALSVWKNSTIACWEVVFFRAAIDRQRWACR
jgi:hypothetical protein